MSTDLEDRVRASLRQRADAVHVTVPDPTTAHRPARTSRNRRLELVAVAAALVLFVAAGLLIALAGRASGGDDEGTPFADSRSMSPAAPQPEWLAPSDPAPSEGQVRWQMGQAFGWSNPSIGDPTVAPGTLVGVDVQRGSLESMPGIWTPTTVLGRPAVKGEAMRTPTVRVEVADGWVLTTTASQVTTVMLAGEPGFDEALQRLVDATEGVSPHGADTWLAAIERTMRNGRDGDTSGYRLGLRGDDGRSYATGVDALTLTTTLVVPGQPTNDYQLSASAIPGTEAPTVPGTPTEVRGHDGVLSLVEGTDGISRSVLTWEERGTQLRLRFPATADVDVARDLADDLQVLDDRQLVDALFPAAVPSDLIAPPLGSFQVPGESTPGAIRGPLPDLGGTTVQPGTDVPSTATTHSRDAALAPWCSAIEDFRSSGLIDPDTGQYLSGAIPYLEAIRDLSPADVGGPEQAIIDWLEAGAPQPKPAEVSAAEATSTSAWAARCTAVPG